MSRKRRKTTPADCLIGHNLRRLRLAAGLPQTELARLLGVTFQQVQKYESGANRLPLTALLALREIYDVPYESFFAGAEAGASSRAALPLSFPDHAAMKIADRLARIGDPAFTRRIGRIIDVLMA